MQMSCEVIKLENKVCLKSSLQRLIPRSIPLLQIQTTSGPASFTIVIQSTFFIEQKLGASHYIALLLLCAWHVTLVVKFKIKKMFNYEPKTSFITLYLWAATHYLGTIPHGHNF